ncbi:WD repeat-containing protein 44-like isoform X2 [Crassostrea angulata]|uniref:WD repeat-containing protein 44-like isoform X2 n=1 Tax=Magallana angulata TaxID=2784310 RepID=UPI0022B146CF|nr:WD repeat-containing protein 44-like isoform X2 [Crassostrea angulata]
MSSDSELDEFYDAEDATPRPILKNIPPSKDTQLRNSLEEQERKLIEFKRKQEEKRRREDEEFQRQLLELEEKRLLEKRQEEEKKLKEAEKRRRKLENMRQKISDENLSTEIESDLDDNESDRSDRNYHSDSSNEAADSAVDEPDSYHPSEVSKRLTFSENMDTSHPNKVKMEKDIPALDVDDILSESDDFVDKLLQDNQVCSDSNEPDIVRSTRTPPNTLTSLPPSVMEQLASTSQNSHSLSLPPPAQASQPRAPPRRRRKETEQPFNELSSAASTPEWDNRDSVPLPSPFSDSGPEADRFLDLRDCLGGRRHIKMEDAELHAVNSDHTRPRSATSGRSSSLGRSESRSKPGAGGRNSMSAPSQGRKTASLGRADGKPSYLAKNESKSASGSLGQSESKTSSVGRSESKTHKNDEGQYQSKKSSSLPRKSSNVSRKSVDRERRKSGDRDKKSSKDSSRCSSPNTEDPEGEVPVASRPRSNSGRTLTDEEILESVLVLNLDTGEKVPLNIAEDKIPKGVNPLTLHIMKITQEMEGEGKESLEEGARGEEDSKSLSEETGVKRKGLKLKKFLEKKMKKNVDKLKTAADQVIHGDETGIEEEVNVDGKIFKLKAHHKGTKEFNQLKMLQDMSGVHTGAVWTMKFSPCGKLLATGGQDNMLRIWVLKAAYPHFDDMRTKYADVRVSPAPSLESLNSIVSENSVGDFLTQAQTMSDEDKDAPFMSRPLCVYKGHASDVLDVSWSKNYFILSSSMDKTVRLWHISRRECLCIFQHIDFVTAIVFHPKDDRYFLSGSLDGKLRLWNIPEKKVTMWNEVSSLITTANFCHNGKFAVAGTYDGKCIFYTTEQLKYYTQIHVRSTRGKNAKGSKITGVEPLPGEDKILVTSNDSRIRLYDLRDLTLTCKYKGCTNNSSQIKASFSPKSKYLICGSEDHFVYIWKTQHEFYKFSSARRDRNDYWEAIKVHNATVTAAVFAPNPSLFIRSKRQESDSSKEIEETPRQVMVTADFTGAIKVVLNLGPKPT